MFTSDIKEDQRMENYAKLYHLLFKDVYKRQRTDHAVQDLALVKALAAAVLFDDDHRQALHRRCV